SFALGRSVLLVGEFALYLAVGAGVGAVTKEEGIAAANRAIAQHHDALVAALDAVQHFHPAVVEPVPDHDLRPTPAARRPQPIHPYRKYRCFDVMTVAIHKFG